VALLFSAGRIVTPRTFAFSSGDLVVRVTPSLPGGRVILDLGPVGELSWHTHDTPITVRANFVLSRRARDLPSLEELADLRVTFLVRIVGWLALTGALA